MLLPSQRPDEVLEGEAKSVLSLERPESRRRLLTDDQRELGDHLADHAAVSAQGFGETFFTRGRTVVALAENLVHESPKGLDQSAEGDMAGDLVELPRDEVPALAHDGLVELLNERRLADSGVPGDQRHRHPPLARAVEGPDELFHLSVPPIELLGDQKEVRDVPPSEGKVRDRSIRLPLVGTDTEVVLEPERALVPLLGSLGEELHDDPRERPRNRGLDLGGCGRRLRDVRVDQLEGVVGAERTGAGQQLVEHDAERVEVRAVVRYTIRPPGLLRGRVVERRT